MSNAPATAGLSPASNATPLVGVVMGSDSDYPTMRGAAEVCAELGVACEVRVVSAHRTPITMLRYARRARRRGLRVIVAGAGGAAHLPGMIASCTTLPVIGVPVRSSALSGLDSLLSIVQMPMGIPVATVAIEGGRNAGLLAAQMLALTDAELARRLEEHRRGLRRLCESKDADVAQRWAADARAHLEGMASPPR
jgi:5-(carboxyamino)imidazole ribonucleotide mutase